LRFLGTDPDWFAIFVAMTVAMTVSNLQDSVMTGLREAKWVPLENVAFALAKIGFVVGFAATQPHKGIVLAWLVPLAATLGPVNIAIFARFVPRHSRLAGAGPATWPGAQLRRVMLGNFAGGVSSLVITFLMPILVLNIKGAREGAYFFVPWTISTALRLVAQNVATSMTVEAGFDEEQWPTHLRRAAKAIARLLLPAVLVILVGGHQLLELFGSSYAREGTSALRLLALGTLPHALSMLGLGLARIRHDGRFVALVQTTDAGTMLALSIILIPAMGFAGAGVAWLVAQTLAAALSARALVRGFRDRPEVPPAA
jgi:O-antigen/teichoic acid export membrane protein